MSFPKINPKQSFPELEEEILAYWKREKIFEKSLAQDSPEGEFKFFDGPPFATGLPHYGHILQGVIKDLIPRYKTMKGFKVPRIWGWDCHGLPVENLIEKDLGLKSKQDVEKFGVDKFNEKCRESVLKYAEEWQKTVQRMGRWIDMENAYKTMDLEFMDSVWWVFGELWKKGLIYEGLKPMHICPRCETPLSNFEVGLGYKEITDLSATVKFELVDEPGTFLLAWTTTPWTLLGNVALAVGTDVEYVRVRCGNENFIVAKDLWEDIFNEPKLFKSNEQSNPQTPEKFAYEEKTFLGSELVGKNYKPLFDYFTDKKSEGAFRIFAADFVTTDDGTGIVHIAPAFGEDDYEIAKKENLPVIQHVSMDGSLIPKIAKDFENKKVKFEKLPNETDKLDEEIVRKLGEKNLFDSKRERHSYPHCWRCETPLLNYATSSWFVAVEKIKNYLLAGNEKINWIPSHIKNGRFGKWLEGARDWAISRNRFWGTPLPIWKCEKCEKTVCVKSKEELEKLSGENVEDLHKHFVDKIEFDCKCGEKMKRIPEVLDCWFESGSMPFASQYSTISDQKSENRTTNYQLPTTNYTADFIAEAQDQTRGWFYTLHVLATALKNKPAFSNCVCSGLVLAEDGEKMSKSKQNFPPPQKIFDKYGADAMRLYLMQSQVTHAEDLRFSERGVEETLRSVLLPLWNTFYFFTTYANADGWKNSELPAKLSNPLDRWILSELNILIREMSEQLEKYEIQQAVAPLAKFLDGLTNWYIRRSRRRFWKSENDTDKNEAYTTLFEVLKTVAKLLAPVCPFLAEKIYKDLTGGESVHLERWSEVDKSRIDENLSEEVRITRKIISLGLKIRAAQKIKVRQPLSQATIVPSEKMKVGMCLDIDMICEELNVKDIQLDDGEDHINMTRVVVTVSTNILGPRLGKKVQTCVKEAKAGNFEIKNGDVYVAGELLSKEEASIKLEGREGFATASEDGIVVILDVEITPELELEGKARDLVRMIQDLRKKAGYEVSDRIELQLEGADEILAKFEKYIAAETLAKKVSRKLDSPDLKDSLEKIEIGVKKITK